MTRRMKRSMSVIVQQVRERTQTAYKCKIESRCTLTSNKSRPYRRSIGCQVAGTEETGVERCQEKVGLDQRPSTREATRACATAHPNHSHACIWQQTCITATNFISCSAWYCWGIGVHACSFLCVFQVSRANPIQHLYTCALYTRFRGCPWLA